MIAATDPSLILPIGPPSWPDVVGQASIKYGSVERAKSIACPFVQLLIDSMLATLTGGGVSLVDIRYWPHLDIGDLPGLPQWHYDCYNSKDDPRSAHEEHRLYFAGAGCRTMFEGGFQPPEGWVIGYRHNNLHRIMPATIAGPRLLVRVSRTNIRAANDIRPPTIIKEEA